MTGWIVLAVLPLVLVLFRRWAPRNPAEEAVEDNGRRLPYGAAGACMWAIGILVAVGGSFLFYSANRLWASFEKDAFLTIYPTKVIWCFAPGFAALCIPYFATLWLLRRFGYAGQAAEIVAKGNSQINVDGERVMRWLAWGIVAPIIAFTLPAIPMHLSLGNEAVRITHYAHITPEVFKYADARYAYLVDGYRLRDGTFQQHPDLVLDFVDGRRLPATTMSDGGDTPPEQLVSALLTRTGLQPIHVKAVEDIPTTHP